MDLAATLKELREELEAVKQAMAVFERIAVGTKRGRGRPPGWMKRLDHATNTGIPKQRGRPPKSKDDAVNG
jgi:hypothetical protein